jgi:CHAT domain-containing protein
VVASLRQSQLTSQQQEIAALQAITKPGGKAIASRGWLLNGGYVSPLLASQKEVQAIADLFAQKGHQAKVYLHAEAKEDILKTTDVSSYKYVHIATHGFVDEQYPELSGLLFAQDSTSSEDGILYTGELYNLQLQAELVTLSACETGLGKLAKGEGLIGLTRAMLYAGARNVVVSFWKVPDESTAELMGYFYKALLAGKGKGEALQAAKLQMLRRSEYNHTFFWAPFILIGK